MNAGGRSQNSEARMGAMATGPARSFEQLIVWPKAHQFVWSVYRATENFPKQETHGLTARLRRAAVSIPANIADGFKKRGRPDKVWFLKIAQGSLEECRYYLILGKDLNYADTKPLLEQLVEVSKLLESYSAKILTSGS
jgi:four helix bundle protein